MIRELKTVEIACEQCDVSVILRDVPALYSNRLPPGWVWRSVHGCGLTDYTRREIVCEACSRAEQLV